MEIVTQEFCGRVRYVFIYVREVFPEPGWPSAENYRDNIHFSQPTAMCDRLKLARIFTDRYRVHPEMAGQVTNKASVAGGGSADCQHDGEVPLDSEELWNAVGDSATAVDEISNEVVRAYEASPLRLYVVEQGIITYQGGIGPWFYDPMELRRFLQRRFGEPVTEETDAEQQAGKGEGEKDN
mmetsp:Transcript_31788/g.78831  ORF Transcript_31788/g.78831 Transcript_31788/m.78831 type:complete len:182 (-) Transcript_31788:406-951(-)